MRRGHLFLALALFLPACAPADEEPSDGEADGELTTGPATSTGAVTARHAVTDLRVAAAETRAVNAAIDAHLGPQIAKGAHLVVIRELSFDGTPTLLVADTTSFRTSVVSKAALADRSAPDPVQDPISRRILGLGGNVGLKDLTLADRDQVGKTRIALTIDMCQSSRSWEKEMFDWLVATGESLGSPLTVGVAMTGGWAKAHPTELSQLLAWDSGKKLDVVWVNHSLTHPLNCTDSTQRTCAFLTAPTVDFENEVLGNESLLLSVGAVPSALFRFPGLTHDARTIRALENMMLLPLDADAWLAKGEHIHDAAVVLVHGNGNEASGVRLLLAEVRKPAWQTGLVSGEMQFVSPLLTIGKTAQ